MYFNTQKINLNSKIEVNRVKEFLKGFALKYEDVDYTLIIEEDEEIIATCSKKNNIVKCFAISEDYQGQGISNILITDITNKLFEEGIYHNFIFTKPSNNFLFEGLGYKVIVDTDKVSLLEAGNKNIHSELKNLKKNYEIKENEKYAALIMNCNPFTLGHKYIVEKAAKENSNVIIFVVEEDKSSFPFQIRFDLIKEGVKELKNVTVIPGGNYIISSATFPNYFLRKDDDILKEYTKIDGNVFGKYFCKELNITKRYVGSEPYCNVTNTYNETLKEVLPKYGVKVEVIERYEIENKAISASRVRELLKEDRLKEVRELVPKTTYEFLESSVGKDIIEKLKLRDLPH
ncbi:[citrate (pro-3S)-lyase] ligase [uncultured Clostridium sp.]|uniref:[citrate (pro-3S)-lyase] ligase n=1 Tax=uncultured Clostridium sp. TaxID=59620 RepID=UPI003217D3D9